MEKSSYRSLLITLLLFSMMGIGAYGQEQKVIPPFEFTFGPRIGVIALNQSVSEFTQSVNKIFPGDVYIPVLSIFGVNFEQRILLGETNNQFIFHEVLYILGLEQSIFIPSAAMLIGYRDQSGFEFGFGPSLSIESISVVVAVGYTFSFSGVHIPIDLSFRIPSRNNTAAISLSTGFNFTYENQ